MEFGSKYAYMNSEDVEEIVAAEELALPVTSNLLGSSPAPAPAPAAQAKSASSTKEAQQPQYQSLADFKAHLSNKSSAPAPAASSTSFLGGLFSRGSAAPARPAPVPLAPAVPHVPHAPHRAHELPRKVFRRHADTNVVSIKFDSLAKNADDVFAGDPVFCEGCLAALSKTSTLTPAKVNDDAKAGDEQPKPEELGGEMLWKCEFCSHENKVELAVEELPKTEARDYVLEPAPENKDMQQSEGTVIFCIDISGSMCVTKQIPGKFKLKGANPANIDIPNDLRADFVEGVNQRSSQTSTWVSRLQCVQAAVDQQIEDWKQNAPNRKVGLITFNREVTIIGDGSTEVEVVTGDKLRNQKSLEEIGQKHDIPNPISKSAKQLSQKLFSLEESGATALGPAMLIAISMASKQKGSRVVVCTDGLANVGLGSMDKLSDNERTQVEQWYDKVGEYAQERGVMVSVISIKGDECALEDLGRVAEKTGGDVLRVDPVELTKNFKSILEKPVIATTVSATFILHQGLSFRNEDEGTHRLLKDIGNVTEDSEVTFEYQMQSKESLARFKDLKELPFQVQIRYTKLDGMKCLRVISKSQPITQKREEAERDRKSVV